VDKQDAARYEKIDGMTFAQKQATLPPGTKLLSRGERGGCLQELHREEGDTLEKIAQDRGVSIGELKHWNHLKTSRIKPGQELAIHDEARVSSPADAKAVQGVRSGAGGEKVVIYKVKKGDTIWEIARAHNVERAISRAE